MQKYPGKYIEKYEKNRMNISKLNDTKFSSLLRKKKIQHIVSKDKFYCI